MARSNSTETDPLADYPAEYLSCRTDRHRWSRAIWSPAGRNVSERIRQCETCGLRCVWVVDTKRWTRIGDAKYRYAPGFLRPRSGLVRADFVGAHLRNDFAAAKTKKRSEEPK